MRVWHRTLPHNHAPVTIVNFSLKSVTKPLLVVVSHG
jgi:hypothetical protein